MATGEIVSSYCSGSEPLGVTHVRCGNRRARVCPSCSRLYAADMFHLIRAGITGGKTVPESVAENPLVFATVTAPPSGRCTAAATRRVAATPRTGPGHGARTDGPDLPATSTPRTTRRLVSPCARSATTTPRTWSGSGGHRTCGDASPSRCAGWWPRRSRCPPAGWARSRPCSTPRSPSTSGAAWSTSTPWSASTARDPEGFAPAPAGIDAARLADLVRQAVASVRLTVPGVDSDDPARVLAFGRQLDVRPVRTSRRTDDPDRTLSPEQVAGYLAKYATKSATDTGAGTNAHHRGSGPPAATSPTAQPPRHTDRTYRAARQVGGHARVPRPLRLQVPALLDHPRSPAPGPPPRPGPASPRPTRAGRPLDLAAFEADLLADEETETTLVVGHWQYLGTGWATEAERVLAVAAAARAREYDRQRAEERHQQQTLRKMGEENG